MSVDARTDSTGGRKDCDFGHGFGGRLRELRQMGFMLLF